MSAALLAMAMLAQPEASVGKRSMLRVAQAILPAAKRYKIAPAMLAAVALIETGGRNITAYKRGKGRRGADVGVFQIHCREIADDRACVARYRDVKLGAMRAAQILAMGRNICMTQRRRFCKRGWWVWYNSGSRCWGGRLTERLRALEAWMTERTNKHLSEELTCQN